MTASSSGLKLPAALVHDCCSDSEPPSTGIGNKLFIGTTKRQKSERQNLATYVLGSSRQTLCP